MHYRINVFDFPHSNTSYYCLWRKDFLKGKIIYVSPFKLNRPLLGAENNSKKVTGSWEEVTFVECHVHVGPHLHYHMYFHSNLVKQVLLSSFF